MLTTAKYICLNSLNVRNKKRDNNFYVQPHQKMPPPQKKWAPWPDQKRYKGWSNCRSMESGLALSSGPSPRSRD